MKRQHIKRVSAKVFPESDKRLSLFINAAPIVIILLSPDGKILQFNSEAEKLYEVKEADVIGKDYFKTFLPEEVQEHVRTDYKKVLAGKPTKNFENDVVTKNGKIRTLIWSCNRMLNNEGKVVAAVAMGQNITERIKVEKGQKLLTSIVNTTTDFVGSINTKGEVVFMNKAAKLMTGHDEDEDMTKHKVADFHPEWAAKKVIEEGLPASVETGSWAGETALLGPDGKEFPVSQVIQAHAGKGGSVKYYSTIIRDITESKRSKQLSDALNTINSAITATLNFDKIMQTVVKESAAAIGVDTIGLLTLEDDRWIVKYGYGSLADRTGESFNKKEILSASLALETQKPFVSNDSYNDKRLNIKLTKNMRIRSLMSIPVIPRKGTLSALNFIYHRGPIPFSKEEIDFANKLSVSLALAISNAHLFSAVKNIANTLQDAIMTLPQKINGVSLGHTYRSATEIAKVGGDFFDIFELEQDKVGIIIGDVSGKGIGATRLAMLVKDTLKAYAFEYISPASVLAKTDNLFSKQITKQMFVTAFFAILNIKTGELIYSNAGHPPPIIRKSNFKTSLISAHSAPLGVLSKQKFVEDNATLDKDSKLILYTDGVLEARTDHELYGEDRLRDFIESEKADVKQLPEKVLGNILDYSNGKLEDDVVILALSLK